MHSVKCMTSQKIYSFIPLSEGCKQGRSHQLSIMRGVAREAAEVGFGGMTPPENFAFSAF